MVSPDYDLMFEVEVVEKLKKSMKIFFLSVFGEVPSVDENIALFRSSDFLQNVEVLVSVRYS